MHEFLATFHAFADATAKINTPSPQYRVVVIFFIASHCPNTTHPLHVSADEAFMYTFLLIYIFCIYFRYLFLLWSQLFENSGHRQILFLAAESLSPILLNGLS